MTEVRNTFIKSKMNKDLDARIVPDGEYRDAVNIAVNTSEGADVGALENVLGNIMKTDFGLSTICSLEVIGYHMDNINNRMFIMLTDYTDTSSNKLKNHSFDTSATSYIALYSLNNDSFTLLVGGSFLNFSTTHPILGINVLENYLFWTDNRNQPRKININTALANPANGVSPYYTEEQHISVAKFAPFQVIELVSAAGASMKDTTSQYLPGNSETTTLSNPDYDPNWVGDGEFLKDRMVRFSYRFKYDDGEYSTIAPFTQVCFVPEQDGYFTKITGQNDQHKTFTSTEVPFMRNKVTQIALQLPAPYIKASVGNLWSDVWDDLKIVEVDILYKESNGLAVKVVDTITRASFGSSSFYHEYVYNSQKPFKVLPEKEIVRISDIVPIRALTQEISGNRVIYANFINKHTSPPNLTYTITTQNKGSNEADPLNSDIRKEYQNHTLKQNRTYQVGIVLSDAYGRQSTVILSSLDTSFNSASTIFHKYLSHDIITATDTWPGDALNISFPASGIPEQIPFLKGYPGMWSQSNPLGWYSYKVVVKQQEQEYYNIYFPGLLNGYTNPQADAEVDYPIGHFVLTGDNINKVPKDLQGVGPAEVIFSSKPSEAEEVRLDMIEENLLRQSKRGYYGGILRKEASEANPNTSLSLYGRVMNDTIATKGMLTPTRADIVTEIGTLINLGLVDDPITPASFPEYAWDVDGTDQLNNFAIARVSLVDYDMGVTSKASMTPTLAVYETKPVESKLDIYWETSTCDNAIQLNYAINNSDTASVTKLLDYDSYIDSGNKYDFATRPQFSLYESSGIGSTVVRNFFGYNIVNDAWINGTFEIASVINNLGADVTSNFSITGPTLKPFPINQVWKIITTNNFVSWGDERDNYTITIKAKSNVTPYVESYFTISGIVKNSPPVITSPAASPTASASTTTGGMIYTLVGNNGSASVTELGQNLFWNITSQVKQGEVDQVDFFYLNNQTMNATKSGTIELYNKPMLPSTVGIYDIEVSLSDRSFTGTRVSTTTFNVTIT